MLQIKLFKPLKGLTITYTGELLARTATSVTVRASWEHDPLDLGLLHFEPGDQLVEHFYSDRWYNIYELRGADGHFKGWYCNLTRPATLSSDVVESEDLELDLLVSADRRTIRLDDEEEFAARKLKQDEPAAYAAALAAVEELLSMVAGGIPPFDAS